MNDVALRLDRVSKAYPIHRTAASQALAALGVHREGGAEASVSALSEISFEVRRGERVALVGRNGAGKSTLLKIVSGTLQPTSGRVEVNGRVSALFDLGVGFHDEFSGYENIRSALAYNDLSSESLHRHVEDVISFCELGDYLHLPIKTYSAGMRARLFFAVASAIEPDILIIDEVLGAGDAYFGAKSADRIARLTGGGTTLLLVSHNLAQVRQMCERAIWIDRGVVRATGPTDQIIAEYEEYIASLERTSRSNQSPVNSWLERQLTLSITALGAARAPVDGTKVHLALEDTSGRKLSRDRVTALADYRLVLSLNASESAPLIGRPAVAIFTEDGRMVDLNIGPAFNQSASFGSIRFVLDFRPMRFGPGTYLLRPILLRGDDKEDMTALAIGAQSAVLDVQCADPTETSLFLHTAEWSLS